MTQVTKKPKKEDYGYQEQELTGEQGVIYYQVKERICFIAENKLEKILK